MTALPALATASGRSRPLRVVSWNLHGCVGTDGRLDPARVARVLAALDADVVGLQEVDGRHPHSDGRDQLDGIAHALGLEALRGPNLRDERGEYGNALLTRLPVLGHRRVDLSVPGLEPRGLLLARLALGPTPLRVGVVHLGLRLAERADQIAKVGQAFARADDESPSILMGDLNEWRPWPLGPRLSPRPFAFSSNLRTFPSRLPLLALDRILAHPRPGLVRVERIATAEARRASDHLPLLAELHLQKEDP